MLRNTKDVGSKHTRATKYDPVLLVFTELHRMFAAFAKGFLTQYRINRVHHR